MNTKALEAARRLLAMTPPERIRTHYRPAPDEAEYRKGHKGRVPRVIDEYLVERYRGMVNDGRTYSFIRATLRLGAKAMNRLAELAGLERTAEKRRALRAANLRRLMSDPAVQAKRRAAHLEALHKRHADREWSLRNIERMREAKRQKQIQRAAAAADQFQPRQERR